ncbi:MAG TPA: YqgE/AlgH family protein [Alphaproteobacteria bacterium]|nr:YqgE/AlgH family protein [Alphaproteobacteria bacterium]
MKDQNASSGYLAGQLLIAMPTMQDPRFARTIVYMCAHTSDGAMGLVINRLMGQLTFPELLEQIGITATQPMQDMRVHFGGPVESGRGFVLHSADFQTDGTLIVEDGIALTASVDILKAIAEGRGPRQSLLALGYAGWGAGQLESEIQANGWLSVQADEALVFDGDLDTKWERAMMKLGVDSRMLSGVAGHA